MNLKKLPSSWKNLGDRMTLIFWYRPILQKLQDCCERSCCNGLHLKWVNCKSTKSSNILHAITAGMKLTLPAATLRAGVIVMILLLMMMMMATAADNSCLFYFFCHPRLREPHFTVIRASNTRRQSNVPLLFYDWFFWRFAKYGLRFLFQL